MKKVYLFILFIIALLAGCNKIEFSPIDHHHSFVASVNILQPSITFYDASKKLIAKWELDKAYTGAELIGQDQIILYGHQLDEAKIFQLSTGRQVGYIETGIGTTNAYYDKEEKLLFLTNSERNSVISYDSQFEELKELKLRNYPMSMASNNGSLYVVNYKDTILSVIDIATLTVKDEWTIDKSSNGVLILPEMNQLWIGGHGEGSKPNQTIDVLDLETGKVINQLQASIMPIGFSRNENTIYVTNHGSNELCAFTVQGELLWKTEVGANPFVVTTFQDELVVAGYDDHTIYYLSGQSIQKSIETEKGPFQLLVREV
ncbi:YncE family protein [Lysinibacillus antri]|uniref:YncE family protein n=1 Tax=Lysinibacillus antri TaxID=2498145 RepID=A0A432L861_9BACI|nr:YncE family protein [Lysinibacillus antri]RUL47481.1 YncE family protein [Lysinibacillus antri]